MPAATEWQRLVVDTLVDNSYAQQRAIVRRMVADGVDGSGDGLADWIGRKAGPGSPVQAVLADIARAPTPDLAMLTVASQRMRAVVAAIRGRRPSDEAEGEAGYDGSIRIEHDLLGDSDVPADAYYGVHTLRAVENFPITGTPISHLPGPDRRARLRQAGGGAGQPRARPAERGAAGRHRRRPARRFAAARLHDQFVVDVIQGGAGTSTNMNANEVIANRALELLGHAQGRLRRPAPERPRQHAARAPTTSIRRR